MDPVAHQGSLRACLALAAARYRAAAVPLGYGEPCESAERALTVALRAADAGGLTLSVIAVDTGLPALEIASRLSHRRPGLTGTPSAGCSQ